MTTSEETWRPVVGFASYEVSDAGNVRSVDRWLPWTSKTGTMHTRFKRGTPLRPMINTKRGGYRYVNLRTGGEQRLRRVGVLVAAAFKGPRPAGKEVCHDNGVATDDRADNLRYDTPKNNSADRIRHGTMLRGEDAPLARLTTEQVREIKTTTTAAETLASRFGVHPGHINNIRAGKRWAHV